MDDGCGVDGRCRAGRVSAQGPVATAMEIATETARAKAVCLAGTARPRFGACLRGEFELGSWFFARLLEELLYVHPIGFHPVRSRKVRNLAVGRNGKLYGVRLNTQSFGLAL